MAAILGVEMVNSKEITDIEALKKDYDYVVLAVGASEQGVLKLEAGDTMNALDFLARFKATEARWNEVKRGCLIGGGATHSHGYGQGSQEKRRRGKVSLVYRRTRRYMPADEEELVMAVEDGVEFAELLAPVKLENGVLYCKKMVLGDMDASGRRGRGGDR